MCTFRFHLLALEMAATALISCQSLNRTITEPQPSSDIPLAEITSVGMEIAPDSKTSLSYNAETNSIKCFWSEGDQISLSDLSSTATFTLDASCKDSKRGIFNGTASIRADAKRILAIYPASSASLSDGKMYVTIPKEQSAGNEGVSDIKMAVMDLEGIGSSVCFNASNLSSIFRLKLTLPETLDGVPLSAEDILSFTIKAEGSKICGKAVIDDTDNVSGWDCSEIKYEFANGTKAAGLNEALILIAPSVFTDDGSTALNYRVETSNYYIDFRFTPTMAFEAGLFHNAVFNLGKSSWKRVSLSPSANRDYAVFEKAPENPQIDFIKADVNNITVGWTEPSTQTNRNYTVEYSTDASFSDANTVSRNVYLKGSGDAPMRYCIPCLEPGTNYYIRVRGIQMPDETDYSDAVSARTSSTQTAPAKSVAFQDFNLLSWGGNYALKAGGTKTSKLSCTSLSEVSSYLKSYTATDYRNNTVVYYYTNAGSLTSNFSGLLEEAGLSGWGFTNCFVMGSAIKVGDASKQGSLTTPTLEALPNGEHEIKVRIRALAYTYGINSHDHKLTVSLKGSSTTIASQTITLSDELDEHVVSLNGASSNTYVEISTSGTSDPFVLDEICITSDRVLYPITPSASNNVYGRVEDEDGNGISNVQVSDGYVVTKTDANGVYQFNSGKTASTSHGYVFISIPSGYDPQLNGVFPHFWDSITADNSQERHDFVLKKTSNSDHVLLVLGDFHLCNRNALYDIKQFAVCADELNGQVEYYRGLGKKVYVITLGDMTWDLYWDSNQNLQVCNFDLPAYKSHINSVMTSVPFFHTMGNHDYDYTTSGDWETAKPYKQHIGPTYYSFNLGGFHYIVLDNVISENNGTVNGRANSMGINDDQIAWVKKDIANVASGVPVVVTLHEQVYSLSSISGGSVANSTVTSLNSAIGSGHKIHYISGDTHNINNYGRPSDSISEHNAGAVCGDWWWTGRLTWKGVLSAFSNYKGKSYFMQARDGSPSGYTIYEMSGTTWKNQWKGFGLPLSKQFKTYDRNQILINSTNYPGKGDYAASINADSKTAGYDSSSSANEVYINIWNWDPSWTLTVYDNSSKQNLDVTWPSTRLYDPMALVTYNAGRYAEGSNCTSTFKAKNTMYHICKVTASSASSTLTITVTDGFGRQYTETMTRPKAFTIDWD